MRRAFCTEAALVAKLKKPRKCNPDALYVATERSADRLFSELKPRIVRDVPLVEVNPGLGHLTRKLLGLKVDKFSVFEPSPDYEKHITDLQKQFPNRLEYKKENFFHMWKLAFLDNMDDGCRIEKLFDGFQQKEWTSGYCMTVFGCLTNLNFIKHLISSIIFQNTIFNIGRPEFYLLMSPENYFNLGRNEQNVDMYSYKPTPALFNMLFDHKLIKKMPCTDFTPLQVIKPDIRGKLKREILTKEKDHLYLVHISPKLDIPCSSENLPLLWYFCKHHFRSSHNRIIPKLEEWIPGCGIWLITEQDPPDMCLQTAPSEKDERLPHITIFTQFRDLSPEQKLTLFKKFISWPGFEQSPFREILDNHLNKQLSSYDPDVKIDIIDNDDEIPENEYKM